MARTTFSDTEIAYLNSQRLGRIATVDRRGAPRVVPTGFRYNPHTGTIDCGGLDLAATRRYQDVKTNPAVAIAIDDLASVDPWQPRAVMVRGTAQFFVAAPMPALGAGGLWMRITPTSITSLGLST